MDKQEKLTFRQELAAAGLDISSRDFLQAFRLTVDQQRAAPHGASGREMSQEEAAAYEAGGFDLTPPRVGGGGSLMRSLVEFTAMIAESLSIEAAAGLLGVGDSRVRQRVEAMTLYGFRRGRQTLVPRFQFDQGQILPGLGEVLRELDPDTHPLSVFSFFMTPQADLTIDAGEGEQQVSPRDWLRFGLDPQAVVQLARNLVLI